MDEAIHRLKIWLKVFIPNDIDSAKTVPGSGPHAGKTMLPSPPPVTAHFLTDQRGFSSYQDAQCRMHSEIEIDAVNALMIRQFHTCHPTIQVDPDTGEEKCHQSADNRDMYFSDFRVTDGGLTMAVDLHGSTKNPCLQIANIKLSPNVDYEGTLSIQMQADRRKVIVAFDGKIETYPAFEMYAIVNGGQTQVIFQEPVQPGSGVLNMAGPPTRAITCRVELAVETTAS